MKLRPVSADLVLKDKVYLALRDAITHMDIYSTTKPPKLDERRLGDELGVSRTPVREALSRLEQEGLVQLIPRRGAFVVRKTKGEILEMIHVWAALESMAARLGTQRASDAELDALSSLAHTYNEPGTAAGHIDEYSDTNIRFHQAIIGLAGSELISSLSEGIFVHMRSIRARTIGERNRADRLVIDHSAIVDALRARDTALAEQLARQHTLNLAEHVQRYVDYLD